MDLEIATTWEHPLVGFCALVESGLKTVADVDPMFLSTAQKAQVLVALQREIDQLTELKLRVLAQSDDVAEEHGARSSGAWLAAAARRRVVEERRAERFARALGPHELVRRGLVEGAVSMPQAEVIVRAVDVIPAELGELTRVKAEAVLVEQAAEFGPRQLARLGEHILEVVAPEIAEAEDEKRLRRLEAAADAVTRLTMADRGDGTTRISATIPSSTAAAFKAQLHAFTSPRRAAHDRDHDVVDPATGRRLPHDQQLGQAFCTLIEHVPVDKLPTHGGSAVSVVATIELHRLVTGLGGATLSSGERISAGEARRLACTSGILPAVLGSRSEVLDLGRKARLFTPAQRKALMIRDGECRAHGCDIPAAWTEAHHRQPWSTGGRTDLADGVLLCSRHHHLVHDHRYDHTWHPNGDVSFHRRT